MDEQLTTISPTSITTGYGLNVCLLFNHFADCAMKALQFQPPIPNHKKFALEEEIPLVEEDDDLVDDLASLVGEALLDPIHLDTVADQSINNELDLTTSGSLSHSKGKFTFVFAPHSAIDPIQWKLESERVLPLLKKAEFNINNIHSGWASHIDLLVKHDQSFRQNEMKNPTNSNELIISKIGDAIEKLQIQIKESIDKIKYGERMISSSSTYSELSLQYQNYRQVRN
jgi:hypothetical protein